MDFSLRNLKATVNYALLFAKLQKTVWWKNWWCNGFQLIVDLVFKNSILRSEPMGIAENVS